MSQDPYQPPMARRESSYGPQAGTWPHRPSTITAIGVFGIIVGSLGLLVNLLLILIACEFYAVSTRFGGNAVTTNSMIVPAPSPAPSFAQPVAEYVAPNGLSAQQRAVVIEGFAQVRRLSPARRDQLDALLADGGKNVIVLSMNGLTADRVANYITEVRQMPSSSGPPVDMFILGSGFVQISDQNAAFFPPSSPAGFRTDGSSYSDANGSHLAATQINAVVGRASELCNNAFTPAQLTAFQEQLHLTGQTLISPSHSVAQAVAQVQAANALPDGTIAVTTASGSISIGLDGQVVPGIMPVTNAFPQFTPTRIPRHDSLAWVMINMLAFVLSAFLLTCGILVLRNSSRVWMMYVGYCVARVLLASVAACVIYQGWSVISAGAQAAPTGNSAAVAMMLIFGAAGAIYPLTALLMLLTPGVRKFFAAPTVERMY
jgi:hypothetical protein